MSIRWPVARVSAVLAIGAVLAGGCARYEAYESPAYPHRSIKDEPVAKRPAQRPRVPVKKPRAAKPKTATPAQAPARIERPAAVPPAAPAVTAPTSPPATARPVIPVQPSPTPPAPGVRPAAPPATPATPAVTPPAPRPAEPATPTPAAPAAPPAPPATAPPAPPATAPTPADPTPPADKRGAAPRVPKETADLKAAEIQLEEGRKLFASGSVVDARKRFISAMTGPIPEALLALARSFDTFYLSQLPSSDGAPDMKRAQTLYERAMERGATEAQADLERLIAIVGQQQR